MTERQAGRKAGNRAALRAFIAILVFFSAAFGLMLFPTENLYLWIKALHVIAVISWMAGMLYLPRLFVYHTDAEAGSPQSETFKVMEKRLLKVIMNPAMVLSWVLGLFLAWNFHGFQGGWLHAKLFVVILLSAVHGHFAGAVRAFSEDRNKRSPRYWRMMNEVPAVLMILIVILVVVKPL